MQMNQERLKNWNKLLVQNQSSQSITEEYFLTHWLLEFFTWRRIILKRITCLHQNRGKWTAMASGSDKHTGSRTHTSSEELERYARGLGNWSLSKCHVLPPKNID